MSENQPDVSADIPSPLRSLLTELHEMYQELILVGFPERAAIDIISRVVSESMLYRISVDFGGDEEDLDDDDEDAD